VQQPRGDHEAERPLRMDFGRRLREARQRAGLSQAQVAERAGIKQTHVSRVERGHRNLTLDTIEALAQAVGCAVSIVLMPRTRGVESKDQT
jgi:transcriptional regulator with XRE-family HTH domain